MVYRSACERTADPFLPGTSIVSRVGTDSTRGTSFGPHANRGSWTRTERAEDQRARVAAEQWNVTSATSLEHLKARLLQEAVNQHVDAIHGRLPVPPRPARRHLRRWSPARRAPSPSW